MKRAASENQEKLNESIAKRKVLLGKKSSHSS